MAISTRPYRTSTRKYEWTCTIFEPCTRVGFFLKKANHHDNFDCYTIGNAKPVVGTSENVAEPYYDVIKMAAILNFNTNVLCFMISIIVGRYQILGIKMFKMISAVYSHLKMAELNDDVTKIIDL